MRDRTTHQITATTVQGWSGPIAGELAPAEVTRQGIIAIVSFAFLAAGIFSTILVELVTRVNASGGGSAGPGSVRGGVVIDLSHLRSR